MFCFVMALKSKQVSSHWGQVCRLLDRTLASVFGQVDGRFHVVLACHETPESRFLGDARLRVINAPFPIPARREYDLFMADKWAKLALAMVEVGRLEPRYVMCMDADDLVHRDVVKFALQSTEPNGWILRNGYVWSEGSAWVRHEPVGFNCGTNAIVNAQRVRFPLDTQQEQVRQCLLLTAGHTVIDQAMAQRGWPLTPLPFPGAMYVIDTGENESQFRGRHRWLDLLRRSRFKQTLRHLPRQRRMTREVRAAFSLGGLT